jgi:alpha-ketoglutarate-dependent taurine dioxygenase
MRNSLGLNFAPLHPILAAECTGIDIGEPISPSVAEAIHEAMDRYAVLVFRRGTPLTTEQQIRFTKSLGELEAPYTKIIPEEGARLDDSRLSDVSNLAPVRQPLVRTHPRTGRHSLYLSSHAGCISGLPQLEALMLLRELTEHATQREFVYRHKWRVGDLVMWDNQATMHRGRPYDDPRYPRDLRRTTSTCGAPAIAMVAHAA